MTEDILDKACGLSEWGDKYLKMFVRTTYGRDHFGNVYVVGKLLLLVKN